MIEEKKKQITEVATFRGIKRQVFCKMIAKNWTYKKSMPFRSTKKIIK